MYPSQADVSAKMAASEQYGAAQQSRGVIAGGANQAIQRHTVGSYVVNILDRISNCNTYAAQIEDRIIGPAKDVCSAVPPSPSCLESCLDLANDRMGALESRLSAILERF